MTKPISSIVPNMVSVAIIGFLILIVVEIGSVFYPPCEVTKETIAVQPSGIENANQYQHDADVAIIPSNGKLYYYVQSIFFRDGQRHRLDRKLFTIENGRIKVIAKLPLVLGYDDRFIYYEHEGLLRYKLKAYDTQTNEAIVILACSSKGWQKGIMESDGTLRFFTDYDKGTGCFVKDGVLGEAFENMPNYTEYEINGKWYSVRDSFDGKIYCDDIDISEQFGRFPKYRVLIPYRDGLLLTNEGCKNLLYYIQNDGTIISIFPEFQCVDSECSVNFYKNYVYLSFNRWEKWSETSDGMERFQNDTLVGTYRINMDDYSVVKISDNIYNGMFIFDDSGIYACDNAGDIHHIDFDGNLIRTIID